jgi:hypothetical protein
MATAVKHTEESMLGLLRKRYTEHRGNGPAWAFVPHVRNAAGFDATRTVDAIAMSLWPSRVLELHGFEVKVSRSDWQRELLKPDKAESFCAIVDRWWLVVSDAAIVHDGELPPTWGLLVVRGGKLVAKVDAPALRRRPPGDTRLSDAFSRSFLAALLRSAARTHSVAPEEVTAAVNEARNQWEALHEQNIESWRVERDELRERIRQFENAAGVSIGGGRWPGVHTAEEVGAALRLVLNGERDADGLSNRFRAIARDADRIASEARRAAGDQVGELREVVF